MNWEVCARAWPLTPQRVVSQLSGDETFERMAVSSVPRPDGPVSAFSGEEGVVPGRSQPDAARGGLVLATVVPGQRLDDEVRDPGNDSRKPYLDACPPGPAEPRPPESRWRARRPR